MPTGEFAVTRPDAPPQAAISCPEALAEAIAAAVTASPLLEGIDPVLLEETSPRCLAVKAGEHLFAQGETGEDAYLIACGIVGLYRADVGSESRLFRKASRGDLIGEYALLCSQPRSASAVALTDGLLVVIDRQALDHLLGAMPELPQRLIRQLALAASRGRHEDLAIQPLVVVLCPAAAMGSLEHAAVDDLVAALKASGAGAICDRQNEDWDEAEQTAAMIHAVQIRRPTLFLVDRLCRIHPSVRPLVDRCLLITEGNRLEPADFPGQELTVDLLRLWPGDQVHPDRLPEPSSLAGLRYVYNVRQACSPDFRRIARCILGQANILVLGGGGAKGFAHIGVLRAIEEQQTVDIDMIYGVSIGAFIGSLYALERSVEEVKRELIHIFVEQTPYSPTLPMHSLFRYNKGLHLIEEILRHHDVGDTWIPFRPGSVNIATNTMTFWHDQSLLSTVIASMSIPGLAPPVPMSDGSLHVDGAVLNNLPILEARRQTSARVVAVSLDHGTGQRQLVRTGEMKTWIQRMLRRLGLVFWELPPITVTIMQSMLCSARRRSDVEEPFADLVLKPNLTSTGILDWAAHAAVEEEGYAAMVAALLTETAERRPEGAHADRSTGLDQPHTVDVPGPGPVDQDLSMQR
ncbi:patatin-like phospholipase family protein [Cyanobium sp. Cruz CV13-4-11]|nr:patatin-like phospholipase family protein [Cyanobium sp. Cruz CV13-4-11]